MNRRSYLATISATSAALLAGCSALTGASGDTNNDTSSSSDSSSTTPTSSPTPTPEPSPIENVGYEGTTMNVDLRQKSSPRLVEFLDPDGEQIDSKKINSATQVSFSLVGTRTRDPCSTIRDPGEYTLAVDTQSGETHRESVTLEPDLSITGIATPPSFGSLDEFQTGKTQYYGSLVTQFSNTGSLPACVTRTQVLGEDIPVARTGTEQDTEESDSNDLYGGDGAGLDWYATEAPSNHVPEHVAVWIGKQRYLTTYLPFVIPASRYGSQAFRGDEDKVREEYGGKKLSGVLTAQTSTGQRLGLPFRALLSGEVIPISRLSGQNVYAFSNPQVAFDPQTSFDAGNTSENISSIANNPPGTVTFPKNATGNETGNTTGNATGNVTSTSQDTTGLESNATTTAIGGETADETADESSNTTTDEPS